MNELHELIQHADWKTEKHVPVIDCEDEVTANELFTVTVTLGKEVAHPNTTEHHIRWIQLYFLPERQKIPLQIAEVKFNAHGESAAGANEGDIYTHHGASISMKTGTAGTLLALSYCNIHGIWQSSKPLRVS